MKYLIASDIHGSNYNAKLLLKAFYNENADKLILLGDILYHGARNDLTNDYNTKEVARLLNSIKDKIVCVRGNCDSEVDQMVLEFSIEEDLKIIEFYKRKIALIHGHKRFEEALMRLNGGDILLSGHTHIPVYQNYNGVYHFNPGSTSIPKGGSHQGYILLEENKATFKNFFGEIKFEVELK